MVRVTRPTFLQRWPCLWDIDTGGKAGELACKHGVWEGDLRLEEAQRMKALEAENRQLKSLLAEAVLDKAAYAAHLNATDGVIIAERLVRTG